jgi:aldehyde dehydrogenase (NAD+)
LALGRLVTEHTDIPPGVFNVISAANPTIGALLTADPRVDMISFTGSTATGKTIMRAAAEHVTKVFLELGGKSAMILLDDLDDVGGPAMTAAFGTALVCGQGCALSTRILIPRSRYDEAVTAIGELFGSITPGPPTVEGTTMGPLIDLRQRDRVEGYVQSALDEGARIVCGGARPEGLDGGAFYLPTLLADVTPEMRVAREEIFGPVLVAIPYDDDDDAVRIANDSIYGLSGHVFGADDERALAVARRIRTGTMSVNGGVWYSADVPFGGYRQSGIGREMGVAGFEEYLETKALARPASGD